MAKQVQSPPIEWRPVVGYEDYYEVSSDGRVRQCANSKHKKKRPGDRKPSLEAGGYERVILCANGGKKGAKIHKLMQAAFLGGHRDGFVVDHINGDRRDNRVENLQVITQRENVIKGNRCKIGSGSSNHPGVCWSKTHSRWCSNKTYNGKQFSLGTYKDEQAAADQYKAASDEYLMYRAGLNHRELSIKATEWRAKNEVV